MLAFLVPIPGASSQARLKKEEAIVVKIFEHVAATVCQEITVTENSAGSKEGDDVRRQYNTKDTEFSKVANEAQYEATVAGFFG